MPALRGESDQALARRFADAERRVRALLWEAANGADRRRLLTEALGVLAGLRCATAVYPDKAIAARCEWLGCMTWTSRLEAT